MSHFDIFNRVNKAGMPELVSLPSASSTGLTDLPISRAAFISGGAS